MPDINIPDVIKSVADTEQAKNLTVPATKSIGQAFGDIFDICLGGLHEYAEKKRLIHAKNIEDFKKSLTKGIEEIPEENREEPKMSVIGPALEASRFYYDEEEIRNMFRRLIVNSLDNRQVTHVHPSFTEIIKQLSPLDAQNLKCFEKNDTLPICEYRFVGNDRGYYRGLTNVFLDNPHINDLELQSVSISSLSRLELINVDYSVFFVDESVYDKFKKTSYYASMSKQFQFLVDKEIQIKIQKGQAIITPFGKAFIKICLSPLPNELNQ